MTAGKLFCISESNKLNSVTFVKQHFGKLQQMRQSISNQDKEFEITGYRNSHE